MAIYLRTHPWTKFATTTEARLDTRHTNQKNMATELRTSEEDISSSSAEKSDELVE
jgi:hypothetical protein